MDKQVPQSPMRDNILKLCKTKQRWFNHFLAPKAFRTSNMLDKLMRAMDRHAFNAQMFHANLKATTMNFRAFAILYNFSPSNPCLYQKDEKKRYCPMARLNGLVYHSNWLENLMIATSGSNIFNHRKAV